MLSAENYKRNEAKAEARGDKSVAGKARHSVATYRTWLDQTKETLADFII